MQFIGILYLILTFVFSFAVVHLCKLAYYGFLSLKKKPQQKPPEEKHEKEPSPKPVYYIVEKKRTRKSYSHPKEIEFK